MANLKQIEKYLRHKKLPYKVVDLGAETFTVKGVVESGVDEEEVVKTLIIRYQPSSSPGLEKGYVALALRGRDRVDFRKVRKLFGSPSTSLPSIILRASGVNCELANADEVKKVVGVPVGAVCPILLDIPIYIDKKVLQTFLRSSASPAGLKKVMNSKHINMGSGDLTRGLEMEPADLLEAIRNYEVEDLVKV